MVILHGMEHTFASVPAAESVLRLNPLFLVKMGLNMVEKTITVIASRQQVKMVVYTCNLCNYCLPSGGGGCTGAGLLMLAC